MKFEELYIRYKKGEATDEEMAFVEAEIDKARRISSILDDADDSGEADEKQISGEVDAELIKKAKKQFNYRNTVRTIITVVCSLAVIGVLACGLVFGTALYHANKADVVSEEKAIENAKRCVAEYNGEDLSKCVINNVEKELNMDIELTESVFIYDVKAEDEERGYKIEVNTASGYAMIVDIDADSGSDYGKE